MKQSKLKIAILSSSTISGLDKILKAKCQGLGLAPEIYVGGYNQYRQEILNAESLFYRFAPDLVILFIDTRALLGDAFFNFYQLSVPARKKLLRATTKDLAELVGIVGQRLSAKIVIHNFETPSSSPLGILENKQTLGLVELVETINADLRQRYRADPRVFVFDYNSFVSHLGWREVFNPKMYYLADIKINLPHWPALADQYLSYIKPLKFLTKKCLVLDLDNTLWGGIIGEDGLEKIKLGPTPEGRPFMELQQHLLSLFHRGVILAVNSKNNLADVLAVFKKHPHMILKEEHFAAIRINWDDKVANLKAIAQELNLGLDSLVFMDDDKLNRELVKSQLPEVRVVDLPDDPALYLSTLAALNDFDSFDLSAEDKKRGEMYAAERRRRQFGAAAGSLEKYLASLGMTVTVVRANSLIIPRLAQLTQKTNQFNLTTRRYLTEDLERLARDKNYLIFGGAVRDKFGDNGLTGVALVKKEPLAWRVETLLLSCRIIGRRVEEVMITHIAEQAKKSGIEELVGEFIATAKNAPAKDFYKNQGFVLASRTRGQEVWRHAKPSQLAYPKFIKVIKK